MNTPTLKTTRLILRRFTEKDIKALLLILKDIEVNKFLPWYPLKDIEEAKLFLTHFFYLFNARAFETGRSALHFKGCKGLLTIVAIIMIGQVAMVEIPGLQQFFNVCGLSLQDWIIIIVGSSLVLWVREGWHLITKR